jgi:hypothetical protein
MERAKYYVIAHIVIVVFVLLCFFGAMMYLFSAS